MLPVKKQPGIKMRAVNQSGKVNREEISFVWPVITIGWRTYSTHNPEAYIGISADHLDIPPVVPALAPAPAPAPAPADGPRIMRKVKQTARK